ncbi:TIGR00730 family protein [Xenococcus sp. PCC 7305]|uniref:LOG family protein n=1 Tax=Xenococcus sp. PCC 7305 TaxID=102125 RepID=UPI0002AC67D2|nr:TIGR00730 family Rossman fold protein [Xenococcus sp. PCC 7305]ELS02104.1 TIGR00730 family protein [Xenococcus sp. PCC 7305]
MKYICVFCGSKMGNRDIYRLAAQAMGKAIATNGFNLVYGGADIGLMKVVADTVLENGGEVIGVIPDFFLSYEVAHQNLTKLHIVKSMHERKALMAKLSDAFIALPGGYGTLEELAEITTWAQLGLHDKPIGILNVDNYYKSLLELFDKLVTEGFLTEKLRSLILEAHDAEMLLNLVTKNSD